MPLTGVLQGGPQIELVPALRVSFVAQLAASFVGAIGAACFGAGISPYITPSAPIPEEAITAIANSCATKSALYPSRECFTAKMGRPPAPDLLIAFMQLHHRVCVAVFF